MAVGKVARARGRANCLTCAIQVVALPFVLGLVGVLLLVANLAPPGSETVVLGGLALCMPLGLFTLLGLVGTVVVVSRAARLDPIFARLGPGRQTSVVGRGWSGEQSGRQVNAWFSSGPQVELYVAGSPRIHAGVAQQSAALKLVTGVTGRETLDLDGLVAGGSDLDWLKRWADAPGVREALAVLLDEDGRSLRSVNVLPDSVRFVARYLDVYGTTPDDIDRWQAALQVCVQAAESVGAPATPEEPGFASRLRTSRGSLFGFLLGIVGVTVCILICAGGVSAGIALLTILQ